MKWVHHMLCDFSGSFLQADTPVGEWCVEPALRGEGFTATWFPPFVGVVEVPIGHYKTEGAAKGACKRYAKRMAAAFKALGKSGWQ